MMQDAVDRALGRLEQAWARMRQFDWDGAPARGELGEAEWRELVKLTEEVQEVVRAGLQVVIEREMQDE